jgi:hypothetical protein
MFQAVIHIKLRAQPICLSINEMRYLRDIIILQFKQIALNRVSGYILKATQLP